MEVEVQEEAMEAEVQEEAMAGEVKEEAVCKCKQERWRWWSGWVVCGGVRWAGSG